MSTGTTLLKWGAVAAGVWLAYDYFVSPAGAKAAASSAGASAASAAGTAFGNAVGAIASDLTQGLLSAAGAVASQLGWKLLPIGIGYVLITAGGQVLGYFAKQGAQWLFSRTPPGSGGSGGSGGNNNIPGGGGTPPPSAPAPTSPPASQPQTASGSAAALLAQMRAEAESGTAWSRSELALLGSYLNHGNVTVLATIGLLGVYAVQLIPAIGSMGLALPVVAELAAALGIGAAALA